MVNTRNAWIAIEPQPSAETRSFAGWMVALSGSPNPFSAIAEDDWILVVTTGWVTSSARDGFFASGPTGIAQPSTSTDC